MLVVSEENIYLLLCKFNQIYIKNFIEFVNKFPQQLQLPLFVINKTKYTYIFIYLFLEKNNNERTLLYEPRFILFFNIFTKASTFKSNFRWWRWPIFDSLSLWFFAGLKKSENIKMLLIFYFAMPIERERELKEKLQKKYFLFSSLSLSLSLSEIEKNTSLSYHCSLWSFSILFSIE